MAANGEAVVVERDDVQVLFRRATDAQAEITRAWADLETAVGSLRGRRFYGAFDPRSGEYRACVEVRSGDPATHGLEEGALPGGRYATVAHIGPYEGLYDATTGLLAWARERGLAWDTTDTDAGERWASRLEVYRTNPAEVPEPDKWETDLMFRLAQ